MIWRFARWLSFARWLKDSGSAHEPEVGPQNGSATAAPRICDSRSQGPLLARPRGAGPQSPPALTRGQFFVNKSSGPEMS